MVTDLKSPQQQVFDAIFKASVELGYNTFDYLPDSSEGLPFVYVGEQFDQDRKTKQFLYGDVQQTIHIYGDQKKRREVSTMIDKLKVAIRRIKRTENFYINVRNVTGQILIDDSTSKPLQHGIIEVDLTFN